MQNCFVAKNWCWESILQSEKLGCFGNCMETGMGATERKGPDSCLLPFLHLSLQAPEEAERLCKQTKTTDTTLQNKALSC